MDLRTTGSHDGKRARALLMAERVLSGRASSYSPFWEDHYASWAYVFTPQCTLGDAIGELLLTADDLIMGFLRGECTPAALEFITLCVEDLVDMYGLDGPWRYGLDQLATLLRVTWTAEEATAIHTNVIPLLRARLKTDRSSN